MSATSRACRARGIWRTARHTDKRAALHRSRPPEADQSGEWVASWMGKSPDTPDTHDLLRTSSRECNDDATWKMVAWNLSVMQLSTREEPSRPPFPLSTAPPLHVFIRATLCSIAPASDVGLVCLSVTCRYCIEFEAAASIKLVLGFTDFPRLMLHSVL